MKAESLDELYEYRDKLRELIPFAKLYKGKINLGDKLVTLEELQENLIKTKSEIASRLSNNKYLKFIK